MLFILYNLISTTMTLIRKYYLLIIIFLSFICSSSSCIEEIGNREFSLFYIENNDDDIIYIIDLPLTQDANYNFNVDVNYLLEEEADNFITLSPGERSIERALAPIDNLYPERNPVWDHYITIWRKETMEKYTEKELRERNIYDAQYILSSKEISDMGSVVHFPLKNFE